MSNDVLTYLEYLLQFAYTTSKEDIAQGSKPMTFMEVFEYDSYDGIRLYELVMELIKK